MANKKVQKVANTPLWKLALRFMISFSFILVIVLIAAELFRNGNLNSVSQSFEDGSWMTFVSIRATIIIGYGFIMAFLTKSKAKNTL